MQEMFIFSVFAEKQKFDLIILQARFLNPAMFFFVRVSTEE